MHACVRIVIKCICLATMNDHNLIVINIHICIALWRCNFLIMWHCYYDMVEVIQITLISQDDLNTCTANIVTRGWLLLGFLFFCIKRCMLYISKNHIALYYVVVQYVKMRNYLTNTLYLNMHSYSVCQSEITIIGCVHLIQLMYKRCTGVWWMCFCSLFLIAGLEFDHDLISN